MWAVEAPTYLLLEAQLKSVQVLSWFADIILPWDRAIGAGEVGPLGDVVRTARCSFRRAGCERAFLSCVSVVMATELKYLYGFGAHLQSEARPGALPLAQNNPLRCPDGLYAEQLSGSAFTVPRAGNCRAWLYRILPSVTLGRFRAAPQRAKYIVAPTEVTPERLRWRAMDYPNEDEVVDFVSGLRAVAGQGDPADRDGMCIYLYAANASMQRTCFSNADGDFLVVPQAGGLRVDTEFGKMDVEPGSIFVVPRGIRFRIALHSEKARGYVCEVFDGHFELPDLGVIGSNGLASPRDFRYPTAWYEIDPVGDFEIVTKFQGRIFTAQDTHSPFNVVAWHGNYAPYSYDLSRFCPVTSVRPCHSPLFPPSKGENPRTGTKTHTRLCSSVRVFPSPPFRHTCAPLRLSRCCGGRVLGPL